MSNEEFIQLRNQSGVIIAEMTRGEFRDEHGVLEALDKLGKTMTDRQEVRMVLDLHVAEFLSSAALGKLVACLKSARAGGGDIVLANVSSELLELLDVLKLTKIFTVRESVELALAALSENA